MSITTTAAPETTSSGGVTIAQMQNIITALRPLRWAEAFLEPVDWKNWGLPDYPEIIKTPMDLSLVETKLKTLKVGQIYNTVETQP